MMDSSGAAGAVYAEQAARERATGPAAERALWIFVHIPKTAGSSFRTALAEQLTPEHNIHIDGVRGKIKRDEAFAGAIDEFLALDTRTPFAFASGHLKLSEVLAIRQALSRPVRLITMLRDPVRRVLSEYRYQCMAKTPLHEQFKAQFPTLEAFVESPRSQNKMFRLLSLPGDTVDTATARLERVFSLVGLVEMYPQSVRMCSYLVGRRIPEGTRLNVTQQIEHEEAPPSDSLLQRIQLLNRKDQRLWVHFRERLHGAQGSGGEPPDLRARWVPVGSSSRSEAINSLGIVWGHPGLCQRPAQGPD